MLIQHCGCLGNDSDSSFSFDLEQVNYMCGCKKNFRNLRVLITTDRPKAAVQRPFSSSCEVSDSFSYHLLTELISDSAFYTLLLLRKAPHAVAIEVLLTFSVSRTYCSSPLFNFLIVPRTLDKKITTHF